MTEEYTITLNKYQRDNLLWLLSIVTQYPLFLNTGDWAGEIPWLLKGKKDEGYWTDWKIEPNSTVESWKNWFKGSYGRI